MDHSFWLKKVLERIPHGEEGVLCCTEEEAIILCKLLIKKGYAVCLTSGDFEGEVAVRWLYAGEVGNSDYANYEQVVFSHVDYLEDYPEALTWEKDNDSES